MAAASSFAGSALAIKTSKTGGPADLPNRSTRFPLVWPSEILKSLVRQWTTSHASERPDCAGIPLLRSVCALMSARLPAHTLQA